MATKTKEELTDGLKKSLPRIMLKQVLSSSLNSLINDCVEGGQEKVERLLEEEEDRFECILTIADDEIEQDSPTQVMRGTLDDNLLILASLVTMNGTEVSLRCDCGMLKQWRTVLEDAGKGLSDILNCSIFLEETYDGDEFESARCYSDESTVYSDNDLFDNNSNLSSECLGFHQQSVKDSVVSLWMDRKVGELQNANPYYAITCPVNTISDTRRMHSEEDGGCTACGSDEEAPYVSWKPCLHLYRL
jgi:hypothetical protein